MLANIAQEDASICDLSHADPTALESGRATLRVWATVLESRERITRRSSLAEQCRRAFVAEREAAEETAEAGGDVAAGGVRRLSRGQARGGAVALPAAAARPAGLLR